METFPENSKRSRDFPQILAVMAAALSSFSAAAMFNWTSPAIPVLISEEYEGINLELASYLSVIPPITTIIICPFFAKFIEKFGRKPPLLTIAVLHLISWILLATANSICVLYISRLLFGVSDAAMFCALPMYISEITSPKVRGTWGNAMGFCIYFGQFAINALTYCVHIKTAAFIFALVPIIFFVVFVMMPESPYYLITKGKEAAARGSLKTLRGSDDVETEFEQIRRDTLRQLSESGGYKDIILIESNRKGLLIAILSRSIQQLSGITPFAIYTQFIFQEAGQNLDKGLAAIIYTGIMALSNLLCSFFVVDKFGRRFSMTLSCGLSALVLLAEAIYFYLKEKSEVDLSEVTWFPLFAMILYVLTYSVGLSLVPTLLLGELFSASVKSKASCLMTIMFMGLVCGTSKVFQLLVSNFGLHVPFAMFAVCSFVGTALSYRFIPETKGKTLEEIQQILKKKSFIHVSSNNYGEVVSTGC